MSEPQYQRDPPPWRNVRPPEPLPESPDSFPWRVGEVVYGNDPARLPAGWTQILADLERRADGETEAASG